MTVNSGSSIAQEARASTIPADSGSTLKWLCRLAVVGVFYGLPCAGLATLSPLIKLSLNAENYTQLAPRIMSDFFFVNAIAATIAYNYFVERKARQVNPYVESGFLPYLGPITAQIPALACLVSSHAFFPGMWAVFNERSWHMRMKESLRLTAKTLIAFLPAHGPAVVGIGIGVGCLMAPFKIAKIRRERKRISMENRTSE